MKNMTKDHKWLLVSCMQKSIRKGFAQLAMDYAECLYEIDKNYLLYRLSIIAIEDIGLGNIDAVYDFMKTQIKKSLVEEKGGKDYILKVVSDFANSIKDRSACDLCSLASLSEIKNDINNEDIFLSEDIPVVNRLMSGWEILGAKKLKNPLILNKEDNLAKFMQLNSLLVKNEKVLEIMKNGYLIHREPHFIALGLLHSIFEKEKNLKVGNYISGDYVEKHYYQNLISETWLIDGIDWHTKEGKSAIHNFCNEKNEMTQWFDKNKVHYDLRGNLIGLLMFRSVGHQVNKRLIYPTAIVTMKLSQKMEFEKVTRKQLDYNEALKTFEKVLPQLNQLLTQNLTTPDPKHFPF